MYLLHCRFSGEGLTSSCAWGQLILCLRDASQALGHGPLARDGGNPTRLGNMGCFFQHSIQGVDQPVRLV